MQNRFALILAASSTLAACGFIGSDTMKLGNGAFSVKVPEDVSFRCQVLHHASDCNNYNVPGRIEGLEVRLCQGESKHTAFLAVTGKHPDDPRLADGADSPDGFAAAWSRCREGKMQTPEPIETDGKKGADFVVTTPLGDGAGRAYVHDGYSVMVMAVPKYEGSNTEISAFVTSLRPVGTK